MVEVREFTRQEVALRDGKNGNPTWVIIRDMVYDVTAYLNEVRFFFTKKIEELIFIKNFDSILVEVN